MPLRIAINATPLLAPRTGIGNYIVELGQALRDIDDIDVHSFYGFRWRHDVPRPAAAPVRTAAARTLRDRVKPFVPFARRLRHIQQQVAFAHGLRKNSIDLYHEPNYVPLRYDVPVVITVHDLSWIRFPEAHPRDRIRWLVSGMPRALERAAAILVDSQYVRDEVVTTFGIPRARVHVAHLGVSPDFRPRTADETAAGLAPFGLAHGGYVLTVGTIEPRKNVGHVLSAYARLPALLRQRFPLVVAGARGWGASDVERELGSLAEQGSVRFLGAVEHDQLTSLYAGAALFVFASLYEGFGLPPLEAMACGTPVLVSNRGSLPEVVGEAGLMLDPMDAAATAGHMQRLLDDSQLRDELACRAIVRASQFTWAACARRTAEIYRAVHG